MSLILNALEKVQQIGRERQERERGFGAGLPWLSRWGKRWISLPQRFLILGLVVATALFLTLYKLGMHKAPVPVSLLSSIHRVSVPIIQNPPDELKEAFVEVPLEEVHLISTATRAAGPLPPEEAVQEKTAAATPKAPPISMAKPSDLIPKTPIKDQVASVIQESSRLPAKPVEPVREQPLKAPVRIRPIPSHEVINHFNLGLLYHKNNKPYEALKEYRKALDIDRLNVQAHNNMGMVYKDLGRLAKAIGQYQKALSINPTYEKAHHNLAVAYYHTGDLEKAIVAYKLAIDSNPDNPETYNNLGLIYRKQKDIYRAKRIFLKGLSIDPDYAPIHYNLALLLEDEEDWKNATIHYRKFLALASVHQQGLAEKVKRHLEILTAHEKP